MTQLVTKMNLSAKLVVDTTDAALGIQVLDQIADLGLSVMLLREKQEYVISNYEERHNIDLARIGRRSGVDWKLTVTKEFFDRISTI